MKFIQHNVEGKGYQLSIAECDIPTVGPHDILIKVAACGVNRADIYQAQGSYPAPVGASSILGLEVSGEIVEMGADARVHSVGDKVCALLQGGGYAEYVVVSEHRALPVPENVSLVDAAGIIETYATAYGNLLDLAGLKPGQSVLIHGGTSGVGTAAIQLASFFGATIFTTSGSDDKCDLCKSLGAAHALNYKIEDFVFVIKKQTAGKGVDVVLDMVGGDYIQRNLSALAKGGTLVQIAFIYGAKVDINLSPVLMKKLSIKGQTLRSADELTIHELLQSLREVVWPLFGDGAIKPVVDSVSPFSDVQLVHKRMENFQHMGKLILAI